MSDKILASSSRSSAIVKPHSIKFYGRSGEVDKTEPAYNKVVGELIDCASAVSKIAQQNEGNALWKELGTELAQLTDYIVNPERQHKRYELEIVGDCLMPYLGKLQGRMHMDLARFRQLSSIIQCIVHSADEHPAILLQSLDGIVAEIQRNRSYLWKSELLTHLEKGVEKQWRPILTDNRLMLQNLGGKFFTLGLIGVVGWPMAVLYPLYRVTVILLHIATEYERSKTLTPQSLFDLGRTAALLFAALQVLKILAIYSAVGHTSLMLGTFALLASVNPTVLKMLAPIMAPHVAQLDLLVAQVQTFDFSRAAALAGVSMPMSTHTPASTSYGHLRREDSPGSSFSHRTGSSSPANSTFSTSTHSSSSSMPAASFSSDRVEELSDVDGERIPVAYSVGAGGGYVFADEVEVLSGSGGLSATGLRRRVI
jgi:hypothetical protein